MIQFVKYIVKILIIIEINISSNHFIIFFKSTAHARLVIVRNYVIYEAHKYRTLFPYWYRAYGIDTGDAKVLEIRYNLCSKKNFEKCTEKING